MGESAMLLRSFSHPSNASCEAKEGDPIRALTESVSFGRFVSESLAWEKWSTFSHNRYLEEVEKFSRPGSVAEKKAYFEAHYKRKAAMKAAALEEANSAANNVPELNNTCEIHNDSPMDAEPAKANGHVTINEQEEQYISNAKNDSSMDTELARNSNVTIDEQWQKDAPDTEVADSSDANASNSINVRNDSEKADLERSLPLIEYAINVENPTEADNLKQLQNANGLDKIVATPAENMLNKEAVDQGNLASSIKKKRSSWSLKSSSQTRAAQLASHPSKQAPCLPPRNVNNINCKNSVGSSNEKKRLVPKTLHMSTNFTSHASEAIEGSLKKLKCCSTPTRTPIRASVNGVSKHLSKIFQSEDKRSKAAVNKSVSGGITNDTKLYSPSMDSSKSSRANGSKTQSPNVSSPFSFRSEERAAKRKEFFQKLEEKSNAKEAETAQAETRLKGKAEHDIKKLRKCTRFGAKQNIHLNCGSNLPSSHVKKMPLTQPRSPKLGGKPTPTAVLNTSSRPPRKPSSNTESSKQGIKRAERGTTRSTISLPKLARKSTPNTVQDASSRPAWRSSMSAASFKHVMEKSNRSTTASVTSLPKKNAHENASPNIQC